MASYDYTFVSGDTITPTKLNDARTVKDIVNADIKSDAAIAFSKLAALDSANILVGNGSNVATKVAVTGDVTISNAGVTAIGSAKVLTAMIADANVTPAKLSQPLTLATAQNTTSGTSIDFTSIPSWVKRITVMLNGVSTNGTTAFLVQLGAGSVTTSGYSGAAGGAVNGGTPSASNSSSGFIIPSAAIAAVMHGSMTLSLAGSNTWVAAYSFGRSDAALFICGGGSVTLSGTLDRVRLTTVGADTFDAGSVNIMYEG